MMRPALLAALLALGACGATEAPPASNFETIKVTAVQNGDRACYFILETGETREASFELCDEAFAGQTLRIVDDQIEVMSAACEGDPNCALTDTVDLIVEAYPIEE